MKQPDYGRAFTLWRNAHPERWERYVRHEVVEQLRKGDLPRPAFLHYLAKTTSSCSIIHVPGILRPLRPRI